MRANIAPCGFPCPRPQRHASRPSPWRSSMTVRIGAHPGLPGSGSALGRRSMQFVAHRKVTDLFA